MFDLSNQGRIAAKTCVHRAPSWIEMSPMTGCSIVVEQNLSQSTRKVEEAAT